MQRKLLFSLGEVGALAYLRGPELPTQEVAGVSLLTKATDKPKYYGCCCGSCNTSTATQEEAVATSGESRFRPPGKNDVNLVLVLVQHDGSRSGKED
ncbi:hypothetical protein GW17_00031679 [Ensete ventricosum]|nr:hypothetical protein GW17_00031679 [Ensete ventricosum]